MGYAIEGKDGITLGAVSALASEALMELMMPDAPEMPKDGFKTKEDSERFEARVFAYEKQAQTIESVSRILIASGFLMTGQDPMLGDRIAQNSIEHNSFGGVEERLASLFKKDRKEDEAFWQEQDKKVVECVTEHPDDILDGTQGLLTLASLYPPALPIAQMLQRVITGVRGVYKVGRVVEGEVAPTKIVVEDSVPMRALEGEVKVLSKEPVKPYEVGTYSDMIKRSKGDALDIHHAPQKHPANQAIKGYDEKRGPSIAVPEHLHRRIPVDKGEYHGTPRDLLAKTAKDLRNHTDAPNSSIQEVIQTAKDQFPGIFNKQGGSTK